MARESTIQPTLSHQLISQSVNQSIHSFISSITKQLKIILLILIVCNVLLNITYSQVRIKERVEIKREAVSDYYEDWREMEIRSSKEKIEGGDIIRLEVGYYNYEGEFLQLYISPYENFVAEFRIVSGAEYCFFRDENGDTVRGSIRINEGGYMGVNLEIESNYDSTRYIKVEFSSCETGCILMGKRGENVINQYKKGSQRETKTFTVECPPLANCGIYGVPSITHTTAAIEFGKKKTCSTAPQCEGEVEPPWIELKKIESYPELCNEKENLRGAFSPQIEKEFSINQIEACYNKEEDRWQFKLPGGNKFYIEYKLEICYENINRLYGNKAIYSLEELNKIPKDSVCRAIRDFKLLLGSYGEVPKGRYYIVEYTKEHEDVHLSDFRTIVNNTYIKDNFFEKFINLKLSCEDVKDINDAKMIGENHYNNLFKEFRKNIKNDWDKKIGQKDSPERTSYENKVHNKIKNYIVNKYVEELKLKHTDITCN